MRRKEKKEDLKTEDWAKDLPDFRLSPEAINWIALPEFTLPPEAMDWVEIALFRDVTAVKSKTDINEKESKRKD